MGLLIKSGVAIVAVAFWLFTQKLLGKRSNDFSDVIHDYLHVITDKINKNLNKNLFASRFLLISSSLILDAVGIFIIIYSLFGPSIRPLFGLFFLFALRQINQAITILPTPQGIIWRDPGFPSIFVTYGVSNDLFFSGHTALAVFGALELASLGGPLFTFLGFFIIIYEVITVILLRAHWTMDVFAGAVTALWIFDIATRFAPQVDAWMLHLQ